MWLGPTHLLEAVKQMTGVSFNRRSGEEVSFSEQGAARQPLLLDSHRWQGIFQNDYTAFAIGMTDSIAAAMLPELPHTACQSGHLAITNRSNKGSLESRISLFLQINNR